MMSIQEVCKELQIDREFVAEMYPMDNVILLPCQIESLANDWAEATDEDFEVEEEEVFRVNLNQLATDLEVVLEIILHEVYKMFYHMVHEGDCFFAFLHEHEVQDLCDVLAEKYDLDFEGELEN
jgi:hypothetical protein